jgi:hypothetical protein
MIIIYATIYKNFSKKYLTGFGVISRKVKVKLLIIFYGPVIFRSMYTTAYNEKSVTFYEKSLVFGGRCD